MHPSLPAAHLSFWGKAHRDQPPPYPRFHPVAHHLLDVAATLDAVLTARPHTLARGALLLGMAPHEARSLLVALAGLHDIGKFAPCFQAKVPELLPAVLAGLRPGQILPGVHTKDGMGYWGARLARWVPDRVWPGAGEALDALAPAVFGHHGSPVAARRFAVDERFRTAGGAAAAECAEAVVALLCPAPVAAPPVDERRARIASWWVAGLVTVADWLGSRQEHFRYTAPLPDDASLAAYWTLARSRAAEAVAHAGLVAPPVAPRRSFARLVGAEWEPSPVQAWAGSLELPAGPVLVVIEDVTGAGKTEAAQVLVHRWMAEGRASGAYWAMPTQATANAMYGRQVKGLEALFADGARPKPSLVLAHGQQRLNNRFRPTVLGQGAAAGPPPPDGGDADDELPAAVSCAAFLADDRRAALLADVGAGTIDQALLGVLPARFGAVRLFGLADHVLVVDEAHAYDAYMGVEIQELLRFQAALGGCAVVLSATLPRRQRRELVQAWSDGLAAGEAGSSAIPALPTAEAYPLATVATGCGVTAAPLAAASWSRREVGVRLVHTLEDAVAHVVDSAGQGGAAVWIRNTVADCLAAAALLRAEGVEKVIVFHARFAQGDRQVREADVLERFGKDAAAADRAGWVLVATQVVEQSLDLDFDAMVSDVAPVDLLIQRAGRLWRHEARKPDRPPGCVPELVVLAPVPNEDAPKEWLGGIFAGSAAVYRNTGILWRTVRTLVAEGGIRTPERLRPLIESVYGEGADEPPSGLSGSTQSAEGKEAGHAATARYSVLKLRAGYCMGQDAWLNELRVPTRLGDLQTRVRLARVLPDLTLAPWCTDPIPWKAWALSEVRLSARRVPAGSTEPAEFAEAARGVRTSWGRWEQEIPILPLVTHPDGRVGGVLVRPDGTRVGVGYSPAEGLAYDAE